MLRVINNEDAFFKGVEVGRAMRGWRQPGSPVYPSGTTYIRENGTHDVARYATANVDVPKTDDISAAQVRALCTGAVYHFPVFTDKALRVWVEFSNVSEKNNGTADIATWLVHFESSANNAEDTLGIILDDGRNVLPDNSTVVADYINTIMGNFTSPLAGFHELTFLDSNASVTGCDIHVYSNEDIEYVQFNGINTLHIDMDNTFGVQLTGDGWASVAGSWHGVVPVTFRVN